MSCELSGELPVEALEEGDFFVYANQLCTRGAAKRRGDEYVHYKIIGSKDGYLPRKALIVPILNPEFINP